MSSFVIFLYSKQIPYIKVLLDQVLSFDFIHTLCVDNEKVRKVIMASPIVKTKKVPCFIVIYPDQSVIQYMGDEMYAFLRKISDTKKPSKIEKSPISSVLNVQQEQEQQQQEMPSQPSQYPQPVRNEEMAMSSNPSFNAQTESQNSSLKKSNLGEVINYTKEKNFRAQPVQKQSNQNINKGSGHTDMARSSLREVQQPSKDLDVIEDIFEDSGEDDKNLINFSKPSEDTSSKKKVSDVKNLINEMMSQREQQLETMR
jgi:hypothetical protein